MAVECKVVSFDDSIRRSYERLLPEQMTGIELGKLRWRFEQNPARAGVVAIAVDSDTDTIVGINAFCPAKLKVGAGSAMGYQSMDTIVDPACRGQGLFTRLIRAFYEAASTVDARVLYGFPNKNSAPGFFNKLEWKPLGTPPFLFKPLKSGYFLKKILGSRAGKVDLPLAWASLPEPDEATVVTIDRFDARFDRLWEQFSAPIAIAVARDHTYLNWRLADHPEAKYQTRAILGADDSIRAFATYLVADKHGGRIGYVMEAMAAPDASEELRLLLRMVTAELIDLEADVMLAWSAPHSPNYHAFRKSGFWPLPKVLRPIELHFGARLFSGEAGGNERDWYISYLDSDTV